MKDEEQLLDSLSSLSNPEASAAERALAQELAQVLDAPMLKSAEQRRQVLQWAQQQEAAQQQTAGPLASINPWKKASARPSLRAATFGFAAAAIVLLAQLASPPAPRLPGMQSKAPGSIAQNDTDLATSKLLQAQSRALSAWASGHVDSTEQRQLRAELARFRGQVLARLEAAP